MGSSFSLPTFIYRWWVSGSNKNVDSSKELAESDIESLSDEEVKALLDNFEFRGKGLALPGKPQPPVWRFAPDTVLKFISYDGSEPFTMHLVSSQTSIPVPKVRRCTFWQENLCVFMEYVEGRDLHEVWPSLSIWGRFKLVWVLRGYIQQLRKVKPPHQGIPGPINPLGPTPLKCKGHYFPDILAGPFPSYTALSAWYDGRRRLNNLLWMPHKADPSTYKEPPLVCFDDSLPLVLTHGDISTCNVRLGTDGKVWLLDWGRAGIYPQWFEYASIMAYKYDNEFTPRSWLWFAPLIAGWYKSQLSFMYRNARGIQHYAFEGFD